ncbi:hypothetical protein WMY93_021289 [Mugilogobius chulae]|uniref:Unique cartilage matrix-associated protein n=1 Tax=Mugilogobius chulae TaxID=88201 RepID=A0AAW0NEV6_9GOBI
MIWTKAIIASLLMSFILLSITITEGATVDSDAKTNTPTEAGQQVFMVESDASKFFKRRSRRSTYAERLAEQRVHTANNERRREYYEEQSNEHENYLEEDRDEQLERSREVNEQFREFHYDGLYPRSRWFH